MSVAEAGRGQVEVPTTPTGADQRPRTLEAMGGRQGPDGLGAGGAINVQDIEAMPGGQAGVGLGVAGPPGQDPGPVTGGVLDPVGDQAAQGVLANLAAARIPTRAADPCHHSLGVTRNRLEAAVVGEGVVQGQDGDAAGGIANGGVAQLPAGAGSSGVLRSGGALVLQEAGGAAAATAGGLGQGAGRPGLAVGAGLGIGGLQPGPDRATAGRLRSGGQRSPPGADGSRCMVVIGSGVAASNRRGLGGWPAGSSVPTPFLAAAWVTRRVTSPASPFNPSSMARTARGMAAAMARATRSGWAWATLPPIEARCRSQPAASHSRRPWRRGGSG
jgi:hypothetical protein